MTEKVRESAKPLSGTRKVPVKRVQISNVDGTEIRHFLLEPRAKPATENRRLIEIAAEMLSFTDLDAMRHHLNKAHPERKKFLGVYIAHDSMGCARYVGRGNIFARLALKRNHKELCYFSFFVLSDPSHQRELETVLIRAVGQMLVFNDRKKRVGPEAGNSRDYEAGTHVYREGR